MSALMLHLPTCRYVDPYNEHNSTVTYVQALVVTKDGVEESCVQTLVD
jgi:hypothetical protein